MVRRTTSQPDSHGSTRGPYPEGYPLSGGVPSKELLPGQPPSVSTNPATGVTRNRATLNMSYDFADYGSGEVRFAYRRSGEQNYSYTPWVSRSGQGLHSHLLTGLRRNTTYFFKAMLRYDGTIIIEGAELSFTTMP